jgi:hypothetical protein
MINPLNSEDPQHPNEGKQLSKGRDPAWIILIGFIIFTILGILGAANFLRIGFPIGSLAVGVFLYQRNPLLYISFTWWLFFLTPLVRRLVDFRSGFQAEALILAAPFLVTAITIPRFIQYALRSYPYRQEALPFVLVLSAICYGFLIGLVNLGLDFKIMRTLIEWITPVSFGFFVFSNWRDYPSYKKVIQKTFFWGTLLMGIYGLVQFVSMPPWDSYWQEKVAEVTGYANAQASEFGSAIWSTTNTNGTLAMFLMPGILLLFNSKSPLSTLTIVIGCLAILLTNARTSWILSLLALLILMGSLRSSLQIRIILITSLVVLLTFPIANIQPFSGMINSRLTSLSNVKEDTSANARTWQYESFFKEGLFEPIGSGISSINHPDSGIINLIGEMGWLGSLPFLGGLILLFYNLFHYSKESHDVFMLVARAVSFSIVISPSGNMFTAQPAFIIWFFASISLAGYTYHRCQLTSTNS